MRKLAVCVGINDYPGTSSDLAGCVNDANDWEVELARRGFAVSKLLDKAATKAAISAELIRAIKTAKSGDIVVFTYSGHGSWQPDRDGDETDGRDEGWCPVDLRQAGLLLDDELFEIFGKAVSGAQIVVLSDSCHSGSVSRMGPVPKDAEGPGRIRFLAPQKFLPKKLLETADRIARAASPRLKPHLALLVSGCRDWEYSYDARFNGRANGAFTYFAIKTLATLPAGATYRDWYAAIRKHLPNQLHPQSPNLYGSTAQKRWPAL